MRRWLYGGSAVLLGVTVALGVQWAATELADVRTDMAAHRQRIDVNEARIGQLEGELRANDLPVPPPPTVTTAAATSTSNARRTTATRRPATTRPGTTTGPPSTGAPATSTPTSTTACPTLYIEGTCVQ